METTNNDVQPETATKDPAKTKTDVKEILDELAGAVLTAVGDVLSNKFRGRTLSGRSTD